MGVDQSDEVDPKPRRPLLRQAVLLLIAGVSLYLIAPSLVEVFSSSSQLSELRPFSLVVVASWQALAFMALWSLQRLVIGTHRWLPVITSHLAANAVGRLVPGGAATSTAVQYRLLRVAGIDPSSVASALATTGLFQIAVMTAIPVVALPAVMLGGATSPTLLNGAMIGATVFVLLFVVVGFVLRRDWPLGVVGTAIDRLSQRVLRRPEPARPTADRLLEQRDGLLASLHERWIRASLLAVARATCDFMSLMAAVAAFGIEARPALVLLAFASSQLFGLVPLTPGGLGFVEAGLTGTLALAGLSPAEAVVVTMLYRLFSFWVPVPLGGIAGVVHRLRFGEGMAVKPAE
ncbi:MAG: lysylphosphatidylglycerol synthase transmembrane domain-containing protein [Acidimicrobiales bacterium]